MERFVFKGAGKVLDLMNGQEYPLVFLNEDVQEVKANAGSYIYSASFFGVVLRFATLQRIFTKRDDNLVRVALDYYHDPIKVDEDSGIIIPRVIAALPNASGKMALVACNDLTADVIVTQGQNTVQREFVESPKALVVCKSPIVSVEILTEPTATTVLVYTDSTELNSECDTANPVRLSYCSDATVKRTRIQIDPVYPCRLTVDTY